MIPTSPTLPRRRTALVRAYLVVTAILAPLLTVLLLRKQATLGPDAAARSAEKLGRAGLPRPDTSLVWINAASVGEVRLIAGLVRALETRGLRVLITTTTASGARTIVDELPATVLHHYLPLDLPGPVRQFLDHWRPDLAVFTESDLWPRLWEACDARGVPLALVNARASKTRKRFSASIARLLGLASLLAAQDAAVATELAALGLSGDRILTGDLRQEAAPLPVAPEALERMRLTLGTGPVWLAASTHPSDRAAVRLAADKVSARYPGAILIEAPRHPDGAEDIARFWAPRPVARHSRGEVPEPGGIYLVDTLGEMGLFYRLCPLVYLGGGMGIEGGHNPQEPAALGGLVLYGPEVAHHRAAYIRLTQEGRAVEISDGAALGDEILSRIGMQPLPIATDSGEFQDMLADRLALLSGGGGRRNGG